MVDMVGDARKITVVQLLPELDAGGVERGTLELGAHLSRAGHRSLVVSNGGRLVTQLEAAGSRHIRLPIGRKSPLTLAYILPLRRLLKREKVDILHLRSRVPAWVGYLAWKSLPAHDRPRLVTTFHGFYSVNGYSAIMTRGEKVIAISDTIRKHLVDRYQLAAERIELIYRGVDEAVFRPDLVSPERLARLRQQWHLEPTGSKPLIMLPGRVTAWKGHDLFLESLAGLKQLNWTALCVGEVNRASKFWTHLHEMLKRLDLDTRVYFVGNCPDMAAAYLLADIVVSASNTEPEAFGRIAVEAQAMGRPVIATAHGGSLETVRDRETGFLVPPGDPKAMAGALEQLLADPAKGKSLGQNGTTWVRNNFSTEKMCRQTVAVYNRLLGVSESS